MAVETSGEVEFQQRHLHRSARSAGKTDDLVDRDRRRPEQVLHDAERACVSVLPPRLGGLVYRSRGSETRLDWTNRFQHVGGVLNECRTLPDQLIAALGSWIERRALPALAGIAPAQA